MGSAATSGTHLHILSQKMVSAEELHSHSDHGNDF
jgi:hypothetical protein